MVKKIRNQEFEKQTVFTRINEIKLFYFTRPLRILTSLFDLPQVTVFQYFQY